MHLCLLCADSLIFHFVTDVGIFSKLYFSTITTSVGEVFSTLLCPSVTKPIPVKQNRDTALAHGVPDNYILFLICFVQNLAHIFCDIGVVDKLFFTDSL